LDFGLEAGVPRLATPANDQRLRRKDLASRRFETLAPSLGSAGRQLPNGHVAVHVQEHARAEVAFGVDGAEAGRLGRQNLRAQPLRRREALVKERAVGYAAIEGPQARHDLGIW
jgi:hypothetical protein